MIPLDSELLNSPERILAELVKTKQRQNELKSLEAVLKDELEQHRKDGRIKGIYKANGVTANRLQTKQKYQYSEELNAITEGSSDKFLELWNRAKGSNRYDFLTLDMRKLKAYKNLDEKLYDRDTTSSLKQESPSEELEEVSSDPE